MKKNIIKKGLIFVTVSLLISTSSLSVSAEASYKKENQDIIPLLSPGDYFRFMIHDFRLRTYRMHIPSCYTGDEPLPIILVLHGHPSNSKMMQLGVELDEKADEEGFIVVYPDGEKAPCPLFMFALLMMLQRGCWWNAWDYNKINRVDDVDFIRELINKLQENININTSRIYITGISGGALMTYRLGAELSDIVAAIAPVAGTVGGIWFNQPNDSAPYIIPEPSNPVPTVIFHGLEDRNVPYEGGWIEGKLGPIPFSVYYLSVNESVSFWVDHNNCNPEPEVNVSGNIIKTTYADGDDDSEVVLYTVIDGGHEWFGSSFFPDRHFSINDNMWDFFEKHPKI